MIKHKINVGLSGTYEKMITPADSYLSNSVVIDNLMSTPALLATIVEISWNMFKPLIPEDCLTVVRSFQYEHLHPSLVGEKVRFSLRVDNVESNKIDIVFSGTDHLGEFCRGKFEKIIVKNDKLLEAAYKRVKM
ncbi:MAG TPA: hypothetical protein DEF04_08275 [Clostridiales bacterium]|nr:hypothetical protein [Clostridiales bacterium]